MKIRDDAGAWVDEEFETLDLGDPRRDRRAKELLKRFASRPTASIPGACEGWSETIAAYRFLGNEHIDWRDMMQPHWDRTTARMGQLPVVLCIADTTELNFNGQDIEGAGPLCYEAQVGMYLHATYAVTPDREPVGVMNAWMWAREPRDANGQRGGVKESARWIESYEIVAEQARALPDTRLVYVADREGDIAALMQRAQELGQPADWLMRSQHNRALKGEASLWETVHASRVLGHISFVLPGRSGQKAREVRQELRSERVTLPGRAGVKLTCVEAYEVDAPAGVKPVIWRLVTNREAGDAHALIELVDWYRARWEIEMFFNVLKNACGVEALQLSQMERVEKALVLYMVVSWRIARLMRVGRTCPELDASLFFAADEIHGAHVLCKKARPKKPPTLNQMIRMVGSLGGFLGRKNDGEPGAKTLWIGMQRVMDAVITIQILRDGYDTSVCATRFAVRRTQIGKVVDGKVRFCLVTRGSPCRDLLYGQQLPIRTCATGNGRVRSSGNNVPHDINTGDSADDAASRNAAWGPGKFRMRNRCESSINLVSVNGPKRLIGPGQKGMQLDVLLYSGDTPS